MRTRSSHRGTDVTIAVASVRRDAQRLRLVASLTLALSVSIAIVGLLAASAPPLLPVVLFGGTMAVAEHRDRLFGDETSVSGSIAVAMATVLVFARGSWLTGPMVCAGLAGCYWPHIRARAWSRIAVNTAAMSLAAAGAASAIHWLKAADVFGIQLAIAGVVALGAFWALNSVVLAAAVSTIQGRRVFATTWHLIKSDLGLLPFGYMGFLTGVLAKDGLVDAWLLLLGVLVLLDHAVIRETRQVTKFARILSMFVIAAVTLGIALATMGGPSAGSTLPVLCAGGLVLFSSAEQLRPGLGFGVVIAVAVASAIALRNTQPIIGPLLVGITTVMPTLVECRTARAVARTGSVAVAASASIGATAVIYPRFGGALPPSVIFGVVAAIVALLSWHAAMGAWLMIGRKRQIYRSALDVFVADVPIALSAGVLGGIAGWGVVTASAGDVVLAAVIAAAAVRVVTAWLRATLQAQLPAGDDLMDVVRSAILDLPASTPQPGSSKRPGAAR